MYIICNIELRVAIEKSINWAAWQYIYGPSNYNAGTIACMGIDYPTPELW